MAMEHDVVQSWIFVYLLLRVQTISGLRRIEQLNIWQSEFWTERIFESFDLTSKSDSPAPQVSVFYIIDFILFWFWFFLVWIAVVTEISEYQK